MVTARFTGEMMTETPTPQPDTPPTNGAQPNPTTSQPPQYNAPPQPQHGAYQQAPPYGAYQQLPAPLSPADEKLWATLIHIGGIFFQVIPALIGFLVLKNRGPLIRDHSKNALNFQITMLLGYLIGTILSVVLIGLLIIPAVYIVTIIFSIIAAVRANQGQPYKYPLAIPFVS